MLLRLSGFVIVLFWLASMTWLVWQDVWPGLTAGEPPNAALGGDATRPTTSQVALYNKYDHRIGTAWTLHGGPREARKREDVIHLKSFPLLGRALIEVDSAFTQEGKLDEFDLSVWADGIPFETVIERNTGQDRGQIHVQGGRFASVYGFTLHAGPVWETFKIPASQAGLIGDVFRPFATLPGLKVGQSCACRWSTRWRPSVDWATVSSLCWCGSPAARPSPLPTAARWTAWSSSAQRQGLGGRRRRGLGATGRAGHRRHHHRPGRTIRPPGQDRRQSVVYTASARHRTDRAGTRP